MVLHLPSLDLLGDFDEKVCTETVIISSSNEMIEAYKSQSEVFRSRVLQPCKHDLHQRDVVVLQRRAANAVLAICSVRLNGLVLRREASYDSLEKIKSVALIGFR